MLYTFSVILPIIDETTSIKKTVSELINDNNKDINKILFILDKKKTKKNSIEICEDFIKSDSDMFEIIFQKRPKLGGAMMDAFEYVSNTTHTIMMSSDLETNPNLVKTMIEKSKINPDAIITASRWKNKIGFKDYGFFKVFLNFLFQRFFSMLYKTNCTDLTYGFRIFPNNLIKKIIWERYDHSFLFETIIKPLKLGIKVFEVNTVWEKRIEGKSNNNIMNYFWYFYIGIKVLITNKNNIVK